LYVVCGLTVMINMLFLQKISDGDAQKQAECGEVAQNLLNTISYHILRTILRHVTAVANALSR
jgi:hypothetical protein